MCIFAEQSVNSGGNVCWCFEEITLMILVQRILMYLWYRLLQRMFPHLRLLSNGHKCSRRHSLPCGQLADEYWKASQFSRTQRLCCDSGLQQPFPAAAFCTRMKTEPICPLEQIEQEIEENEEEQFNFNCSDISHIYQSTFFDEYDECFLAEDIAWDAVIPGETNWDVMAVPDVKHKPLVLDEHASLLLNDFYIDDDLDDHLKVAYQTAHESNLFCDSWLD
ncbi:uncharacterized protein LOC128727008 [Anopheles nili]|uniref:uncharacterized protein LOC128727008 n=1 Tax=Anopheles nili TaxID=185578 RepID=UPI00237AD286|nr:uncharacterized protein LOC128727008 [Anopheles nili]